MCMWQSQAFAGALSLGASLPSEFGTVCCACAGVPAATAAPAPARNVRRPMVMLIRRLPRGSLSSLNRWGRLYNKRLRGGCRRRHIRLTAVAWLRTVCGLNRNRGERCAQAARERWEDDDDRGGRYRSRSRYDDDDDDRGGRGRGGWFGDSEGHSRAARERWEDDDRGGRGRSSSRYDDDDDDRGGRGHGRGGWVGGSGGHARAGRSRR